MNFKDYYQSLPDQSPKVEMRNKLLKELDIQYSTFYQKLNTGTFTKLECERISEVLGFKVNDLFPEYIQP
jgi:hypothetical protein